MAGRVIGKLSALAVERAKKPGMYSDGGGLYLQVRGPTIKSWVFRYARRGAGGERYFGLGSFNAIPLAEAREKAAACRNKLANGIDPIEDARAQEMAKSMAAARLIPFKECAEAYIEAHKSGWKNAKHASQWGNTLDAYAYPTIGALPVGEVCGRPVRRQARQRRPMGNDMGTAGRLAEPQAADGVRTVALSSPSTR